MKLRRMQDEISVDLLIREGAFYSMSLDRAVYRSIAIQRDQIVALSVAADGLNKLIGPATRIQSGIEPAHMVVLGGKSNTDQREKGRTLRMRSDIVSGNVFPDYALPDHTNTVRKLSELQGRDPMVLLLSRGHF